MTLRLLEPGLCTAAHLPRSTRAHLAVPAGKEDCVLLDFTDRVHSLDKESDLVTGEDVLKPGEGVVG